MKSKWIDKIWKQNHKTKTEISKNREKKNKSERKLWYEMSKNENPNEVKILKQFTCNFYRWLDFRLQFCIVSWWMILFRFFCVPIAAHSNSYFINIFAIIVSFFFVIEYLLATNFRGLCNTVYLLFISELLSPILKHRLCNFYLLFCVCLCLSSPLRPKLRR